MQITKREPDNVDQLITWALKASYSNIQPPERVWRRVVERVYDQDGTNSCPKCGESRTLGAVTQLCAPVSRKRISL